MPCYSHFCSRGSHVSADASAGRWGRSAAEQGEGDFPKVSSFCKVKTGHVAGGKTKPSRGVAGPVQAPTIVRWVGGSGKLPCRVVASASLSVQWNHECGSSCGRGPWQPSGARGGLVAWF